MTDNEINAAIGKVRVWEIEQVTVCGQKDVVFYLNGKETDEPMSDYCNDLNAMHDAMIALPASQRLNYLAELHRMNENSVWEDFLAHNATARQRAIAFLKTLGLWREAKEVTK